MERGLPACPSLSDLLQEPAVALLRGVMHKQRRQRAAQEQAALGCGHDYDLIDDTEAAAAAATGAGDGADGEAACACVVCYEAPRDAVFLACGHGGTCLGCALDVYQRGGECPLCRVRIEQIVTVSARRAVLPGSGLVVADVVGPSLLPGLVG